MTKLAFCCNLDPTFQKAKISLSLDWNFMCHLEIVNNSKDAKHTRKLCLFFHFTSLNSLRPARNLKRVIALMLIPDVNL